MLKEYNTIDMISVFFFIIQALLFFSIILSFHNAYSSHSCPFHVCCVHVRFYIMCSNLPIPLFCYHLGHLIASDWLLKLYR